MEIASADWAGEAVVVEDVEVLPQDEVVGVEGDVALTAWGTVSPKNDRLVVCQLQLISHSISRIDFGDQMGVAATTYVCYPELF